MRANENASENIVITPGDSMNEQETKLSSNLSSLLGESKLDAILTVAGGWAGGNAGIEVFLIQL